MSRALKRKHVLREMWEDDFAPPKGDQQIVKVLGGKGNNLHEVQTAEGNVFLVSMPTKFRRVIWVKKGQYVIIEPVKEGHRVKGEIVRILTRDHIKIYHKDNIWPSAFEDDAVKNYNAYPPNYKGKEPEELRSDDEKDSDDKDDSDSEKSDSEVKLVESDSENELDENDSSDNSKDSDSDDNNKDSDSDDNNKDSDSDDSNKDSDSDDNNKDNDSDDNNKDSDSDDNCNDSENVDTCPNVDNCSGKYGKNEPKS